MKRIAILVLGISILSASTAFALVETKKDKGIEVKKVGSKIGDPYDMNNYNCAL